MIDINEILKNYLDNSSYKEYNGSYIIAIPFFFPNSSSSIAIKISFDEFQRPILSDCHTTLDYLDEIDVDIDKYQRKLEKILDRYNLKIEDREIKIDVPTTQLYYLTKYLGYFIQSLSLIANINV